MDTYLAYPVARLCLTDYNTAVRSIKWIGLALIPLSVLGVIESYTGWGPYYWLIEYCLCRQVTEPSYAARRGFYRAIGLFSHSIMFGTVFALFLPMVHWLRRQGGCCHSLKYLLVGALVVGVMNSMSSSQVIMLILISFFLLIERFKQFVKPIISLGVIFFVLVGVISNRKFSM